MSLWEIKYLLTYLLHYIKESRGIAGQKSLGGGTRRLRPWLRRSSVYSSYRKDLRSARKDVDVGRQEGENCVGVGERLEMRGAAGTWKQRGRTTTRQGVKLRELSSSSHKKL